MFLLLRLIQNKNHVFELAEIENYILHSISRVNNHFSRLTTSVMPGLNLPLQAS